MLTPKRIYEEELLDAGEGTDDDVAENLLDLRRINRFLGGTRVVLNALAHTAHEPQGSISLLDVGTGSRIFRLPRPSGAGRGVSMPR